MPNNRPGSRPGTRTGSTGSPAPRTPRLSSLLRSRKGKLSSGVVAMSTAAILVVYAAGRSNTSAVSDPFSADASASTPFAPGVARTGSPPATALATVGLKDGTFTGSGDSRHGGMQVAVVVKGGQVVSANVTSCSTRYPCSDVDALVRAAVAKQGVPASHVSGATDSSAAYRQALTNALRQSAAAGSGVAANGASAH